MPQGRREFEAVGSVVYDRVELSGDGCPPLVKTLLSLAPAHRGFFRFAEVAISRNRPNWITIWLMLTAAITTVLDMLFADERRVQRRRADYCFTTHRLFSQTSKPTRDPSA
jgi:hypothetical protein